MNEKLVTIIIPGYNAENYLDRCVQSAINQTYKNIEIILVDDGSKDETLNKFYNYANSDSRVKVIHKNNDGLANARNSGIEICHGDYVMFADSDDFLEPDMVEFLLNLSDKYDADVSRCGFYFNYEDGSEVSASDDQNVLIYDYVGRMTDLVLSGHISGVAWNKLYKREVIMSHPYDKKDGCSEDIMHNYRVYKDIKKTAFCNIPKYHYVIRNNSITNSEFGYGAFDIIRARKIMLDDLESNPELLSYAIESYIKSSYIVLSGCIRSGKCMDRYEELRKGILSYKKEILSGKRYSSKYKLRTVILWLTPALYNKMVKTKG